MTNSDNPRDMLGRTGLITVEKALLILRQNLENLTRQEEQIPLDQALDRILSHPVISPEDLPETDRSTMDGYAVRAADTFGASHSMPCYLNITGEVIMGEMAQGKVKKGCCFKIPTGGLLPSGADSVVMLEHTVPVDDTMIEVIKGVGAGTNLIKKGEDIKQDTTALNSGHLLRPQDLGLLAGLGIAEINVYKKIRVGIVSTGDEIIPFQEKPLTGQIRNINSLTLTGMVRRLGGEVTDYGIVSDHKDIFFPALEKAVQENDIVLFSGGSSVGVRDLGEQAVEALGPPGILVHGVALKPGKPILIGMSGDTPLFGLPGHPVSALVCFDLFVRPAIRALQGKNEILPRPGLNCILSRNINSAAGRRDLVRVKLKLENDTWTAYPILGKSGSISTLSRADGFFVIDEESQGVSMNDQVLVYLYQ
ncbi:molybdopterin molybdotransferase MoeA [Desulfomarina sp.]